MTNDLVPTDTNTTPDTTADDMSEYPAPNTIRRAYIVSDNGYAWLDGPFDFLVDGFDFEIALPLADADEDTNTDGVTDGLTSVEERLVADSTGENILAIGEGEPAAYGVIEEAVRIADNLHVAARFAGAPDRGDEGRP